MKKIPTLFERDWDNNPSRVIDKLAIDIEPFLEADATVKWDGTSVMFLDGKWYARHTLRVGKGEPLGWVPATEVDPKTGKQEGWKLVTGDSEFKYHVEAINAMDKLPANRQTFELMGPKIQGNPSGFDSHVLVPHGAHLLMLAIDCPFDAMAEWFADNPIEGVVWWLDGEPVAKIKRKDFGLSWPEEK